MPLALPSAFQGLPTETQPLVAQPLVPPAGVNDIGRFSRPGGAPGPARPEGTGTPSGGMTILAIASPVDTPRGLAWYDGGSYREDNPKAVKWERPPAFVLPNRRAEASGDWIAAPDQRRGFLIGVAYGSPRRTTVWSLADGKARRFPLVTDLASDASACDETGGAGGLLRR